MFRASDPQWALDLHGHSTKEAKVALLAFMERALQGRLDRVTIITGIGNHISDGAKRGILFRILPKWLNASSFRAQIKFLVRDPGSYKIRLVFPAQNIDVESDENPLFKIMAQKQMGVIDIQPELKTSLAQNPALLKQTTSDGTTALMVAASYNQVDTMAWLLAEERKLIDPPTLLKQQKIDGTTALMIAVLYNSQEAINYLLKQAPSLLKKRRFDGLSVFGFAAQTGGYIQQTLALLRKHLKSHKKERDRGYTGLFREYRILEFYTPASNLLKPIHSLIPIIESEKFKTYQLRFSKNRLDCFGYPTKQKKPKVKIRRTLAPPHPFRRTLWLDFTYIHQRSRISLSRSNPIIQQIIESTLRTKSADLEQKSSPLLFSSAKNITNPLATKKTIVKKTIKKPNSAKKQEKQRRKSRP